MDVHHQHHDSGAEATGLAAWMVATILLVVTGVVLFIALLVWSPWTDGGGAPVEGPVEEQQGPAQETDIDIGTGEEEGQ